MSKKVAVVTGGNTGIGFATVKGLCQSFDGDVILTALTEADAKKAVEQLDERGCKAAGLQLDLKDSRSICRLKDYLEERYGGLDVLVLNAGVSYALLAKIRGVDKPDNKEKVVDYEIAKEVVDVNVHGNLDVLKEVDPLLRDGARIVTLASRGAGFAIRSATEKNRDRLLKKDVTTEAMLDIIQEYLDDVKEGDYLQKGWSSEVTYSYPLTKLALIKIGRNLQQEYDAADRNIYINSCCPGMVATPMSNFKGVPAEKGAETPIYLATLPADAEGPKGAFLAEKVEISLEAMSQGQGSGIRQKHGVDGPLK